MSILDALKTGILRVEFVKRDGSLRIAYMTQCDDLLDLLGVENKSRDVVKRDGGSARRERRGRSTSDCWWDRRPETDG